MTITTKPRISDTQTKKAEADRLARLARARREESGIAYAALTALDHIWTDLFPDRRDELAGLVERGRALAAKVTEHTDQKLAGLREEVRAAVEVAKAAEKEVSVNGGRSSDGLRDAIAHAQRLQAKLARAERKEAAPVRKFFGKVLADAPGAYRRKLDQLSAEYEEKVARVRQMEHDLAVARAETDRFMTGTIATVSDRKVRLETVLKRIAAGEV